MQAYFDLSKVGLRVPTGWHNDLLSLDKACTMDNSVYKTVEVLKETYGHKVIYPLLTDLRGNFLLIATDRDYPTAREGVMYLRNYPNKFVGVITKPTTLGALIQGLDQQGSRVLDFDEVLLEEEEQTI